MCDFSIDDVSIGNEVSVIKISYDMGKDRYPRSLTSIKEFVENQYPNKNIEYKNLGRNFNIKHIMQFGFEISWFTGTMEVYIR